MICYTVANNREGEDAQVEEIITYDMFSLMRSDNMSKVHPHTHVMYELNYTIEGNVECYQGFNRAKVLTPGYWLAAPGVVHGCNIDSNHPYRRLVLFFDSMLISEDMRDQLTHSFITQKVSFTDADGSVLNDLLALERLLHSNVSCKERMAEILIQALLVNLYTHIFSVSEAKLDDASLEKQLISYLKEHMFEKITLDMLAKTFGMSKNYLNHVFVQKTGVNIAEYVRLKRLLYVKRLVETGTQETTAAFKAGYKDYSTYYRVRRAHENDMDEVEKRILAIDETLSGERWQKLTPI